MDDSTNDDTENPRLQEPLAVDADFRRCIELAPIGVCIADEQARILFANPQLCRQAGYSREELLQLRIGALFPPEFQEQGRADFEQLVRTGSINVQQPFVSKTGERGWVSVSATKLKDGQFLGYICDITEQKAQELQLREERDFSESLLSTAPVCIVLLRGDGTIEHVNEYFEKLTGYSNAEVRGRSWFETVLPARDRDEIRLLAATAQFQPIRNNRNAICTRNGEERLIEWNSDPLPNAPDREPGFLAIGLDVTDQVKVEQELQRSEERLRLALSAAGQGLWDLDLRTGDAVVSPEYATMLGHSPIGFVETNQKWFDRLHPDDVNRVRQQFNEYVSGQSKVYSVEFRQRTADGDWKWILSTGEIIERDGDDPARMIGTHTDISTLKQAQEALQLRLLAMANSISGVGIVDVDSQSLIYANDSFLRIWGYEHASDVIGRNPLEFVREPDFVQSGIADLLNAGKWIGELTAVKADGSLAEVEVFASSIRNQSDSHMYLVGTFHDITGRKLAEASLRASEQRMAEAQIVAHFGNWEWSIDTDTIHWSDEVYRIFGRKPQSFVPTYERDFLEAIPADDRSDVIEAVERSLKDRAPYKVSHRVIRPDGAERFVNEIGHVECDPSGTPVRMIGVVHDITEYRQAQLQTDTLREQLAHASRVGTMGELAAGLAHEITQPLMAVHIYAQTAASLHKRSREAAELGEKVDQALEKVAEQSLRAGEIVQRMRAFIGKRQPQLAECRVNDLVSDVLALLHTPLTTGSIEVRLELADPLPTVRADAIQIQQVLVNLIQNAIDAMSAGDGRPRNLHLGTSQENGTVVVTVADSGPGLPEDASQKVFDPFHSTKPSGMGLGLPICRTLVEAHGGTIAVRSSDGGGAVFEFRLPVLTKGATNA